MKKYTTAVLWVQAMGYLVTVLGAIHCVLAPIFARAPLSLLMPTDARAMLFMILATGAATVFSGLLLVFASGGMKLLDLRAWSLAWYVNAFLLILGVGAAVAMLSNPFAHLLLLLAIVLTFPLSMYRSAIRFGEEESFPGCKPKISKM